MIFQIFFPDFNFSIRRRRTNGPNFVLLPRSASPPTVEGVWAKRCGHLNILNGPDGNTERVLPTEEKRRKKRTAFIAFNACLIFLAYFWILFVFVLNSQTYVLKIYPALQTQGLNRREVVCLDTQTGTVLLVQAATAVQQRQHTHTHKTTHHLDKFGMPQSGMIEVSVHIAGNLLFQGILPFLWLKLWNECFIFNVRIRVSLDASCQQLPSGFVFAHMAVAVPQVGWEEILFRTQRIGRKTLREHSYLKGSACCLSYERRRKSDFYIQRRLFIQQMWLLAVSQRMGMIPFDVNHIPHSRPWVCDRNSNGSAECDSCSSAT